MTIDKRHELFEIVRRIHDRTGVDFTQYKEESLRRRIYGRMIRCGVADYAAYESFLDEHPEEFSELISALTINVTEFFRNDELFSEIANRVIPEILNEKRRLGHHLIRAWSCGCSVGDEPFSLAMLFLENFLETDRFLTRIIGSDIDQDALREARAMRYSRERVAAIGDSLLEKYFTMNSDGSYVLQNSVAGLVKFQRHDVIKDRPFFGCDIILCRNLLIYFNRELQEEILLKFHQCLSPGGYLVLGMTESLIGSAAKRFETVNNRLRIFRRPMDEHLDFEGAQKLTQDQIDRIVHELLGK